MKKYYDRRAPEYDDVWTGGGAYAERARPGWAEECEALLAKLRELPPARTLDVGCGTGFVTRHLPGDVVGLDQSESMLVLARRQAPRASFVVGDALDLPFPDDAFERVFASFLYCHLVEGERTRFLAEARRVAPELVIVAPGPRPGAGVARWEERMLADGSRWHVFKRYFRAEDLLTELGGGGVLHAGRYFLAVRSPRA